MVGFDGGDCENSKWHSSLKISSIAWRKINVVNVDCQYVIKFERIMFVVVDCPGYCIVLRKTVGVGGSD